MTRRWFLGSIASALVGIHAESSETLIQAFETLPVQVDGENILITLEGLQELLHRTPLHKLRMEIVDMRTDWTVLPETPGTVCVHADLPYGGRVTFTEHARFAAVGAGRHIADLGYGDTRLTANFQWRIGRLPLPDAMIDYIPANHPLGKWVRTNNRVALNRAISAGRAKGDLFSGGLLF